MNTDMVMAALNQAIADRNHPKDVIHHSDRGVQYLSIRYTDKMADSGVLASVGTTGDLLEHSSPLALGQSSALLFLRSYDNALAETVNELYRTVVIDYLKQQWQGVNDVELATLEWVVTRTQLSPCKAKSILNQFLTRLRFNKTHLHSTIGYVSPFEFERRYYDSLSELDKAA